MAAFQDMFCFDTSSEADCADPGLHRGIIGLTKTIGVITLLTMSIIIGVSVFFRYVLLAPLSWAEDFARGFFLWTTYCGIVIAMQDDKHLRVEVLTELCPKVKPLINALYLLVCVAFFSFCIWHGIEMTLDIYRQGFEMESVEFPVWTIWIAIPIFCTFTTLAALRNFWVRIHKNPS